MHPMSNRKRQTQVGKVVLEPFIPVKPVASEGRTSKCFARGGNTGRREAAPSSKSRQP